MYKRIMLCVVVGILAIGFATSEAFAFHCPKLISAGRRLAAKASGADKKKAIQLLNEAEQLHKGKKHTTSMQKATDAIAILAK